VEQAWQEAWTDIGPADVKKEPQRPTGTEEEMTWEPHFTDHNSMVSKHQAQLTKTQGQLCGPWLVLEEKSVEKDVKKESEEQVDPWFSAKQEETEEFEDSELTKRLKRAEESMKAEDSDGDGPPTLESPGSSCPASVKGDDDDDALRAAAASVFVKWEKPPEETIAESAKSSMDKPTIFTWRNRDAGTGWSKDANQWESKGKKSVGEPVKEEVPKPDEATTKKRKKVSWADVDEQAEKEHIEFDKSSIRLAMPYSAKQAQECLDQLKEQMPEAEKALADIPKELPDDQGRPCLNPEWLEPRLEPILKTNRRSTLRQLCQWEP
jgi:hypothetical protein